MYLPVREDVQGWCEHGIPTRAVWRGERWRVIDRPTRQEGGLWEAWRFTARSDQDHRTIILDVESVDGRWALTAAFE